MTDSGVRVPAPLFDCGIRRGAFAENSRNAAGQRATCPEQENPPHPDAGEIGDGRLFRRIHQIAQFHEQVGGGERCQHDTHDVQDLRKGELHRGPARVHELAEEGHGKDEYAHAYGYGVHRRAQQVEGLQDAEEHHQPAEGDREHEQRIDELQLFALDGERDLHGAEFFGQYRDAHVDRQHAQNERNRARDRP